LTESLYAYLFCLPQFLQTASAPGRSGRLRLVPLDRHPFRDAAIAACRQQNGERHAGRDRALMKAIGLGWIAMIIAPVSRHTLNDDAPLLFAGVAVEMRDAAVQNDGC